MSKKFLKKNKRLTIEILNFLNGRQKKKQTTI